MTSNGSEDEETITFSDKKDKSYTTANRNMKTLKKICLRKALK